MLGKWLRLLYVVNDHTYDAKLGPLEHTWKVNMCFLIEWSQKPSIWVVAQVQYGAHGCLCGSTWVAQISSVTDSFLLLTFLLLNFSFDIIYKKSSFWPLQTLCYKIKLKCNSTFLLFPPFSLLPESCITSPLHNSQYCIPAALFLIYHF